LNTTIFLDSEKNDFIFLVKIDDENKPFVSSYWYRADEFELTTIETDVPQNMRAAARSFLQEVQSYANDMNLKFISEIEKYKEELEEKKPCSAFRLIK
jgi:hypothetical protein